MIISRTLNSHAGVVRFAILAFMLFGFAASSLAQNNWFKISPPNVYTVKRFHFFDRNTGVLLVSADTSYFFYKTTNGGTDWTRSRIRYTRYSEGSPAHTNNAVMLDFQASTPDQFFTLGTDDYIQGGPYRRHYLLESDNNGNAWSEVQTTGNVGSDSRFGASGMHFYKGPIVAYTFSWWYERDSAYRFTNGKLINITPPLGPPISNGDGYPRLYDMAFADSARALSITDSGIFYTVDTGRSWSFMALNKKTLVNLAYSGNDTWIGSNNDPGLWQSTDAGRTWKMILTQGGTVNDYDLKESIGYVATDGGLYVTTNNGESWSNYDYNFKKIQVVDDTTGYAINDKGELFKTTTGSLPNLSVKEKASKKGSAASVELYPQPARSHVTVSWKEDVIANDVEVIDGIGRTVERIAAPTHAHSITLDCSALPPGLHYIKIGTHLEKLVISR